MMYSQLFFTPITYPSLNRFSSCLNVLYDLSMMCEVVLSTNMVFIQLITVFGYSPLTNFTLFASTHNNMFRTLCLHLSFHFEVVNETCEITSC